MTRVRSETSLVRIRPVASSPAGRTPSVALRRTSEVTLEEKFLAKEAAWQRLGKSLRTTHDVFLGDAREMKGLAADTPVHLVVTSPPYWNLKRYADDCRGAQLGHIDDRERFLAELGKVWRRCYDLLVPGGRMCVVVGDVCRSRRVHGRHSVEPLHAYLQVQCQTLGFEPLAMIIWRKIANLKTEVAGNGSAFLGKPYEPNAIIKNDMEFILMFRKPGAYRHPTQEQRDLSVISREDYSRWFQQVWDNVPGGPQTHHPAPFPKEIAFRLINMFSFVGDVVLDPFWGIGNTTLAALDSHRSSIGFEIEPAYIQHARNILKQAPEHGEINFYEP
jgi:modification methylase